MGHAAREYFAHRSQIFTETVRAAFIKKHETRRSPTDRRGGNCTDAHGWVFSRIVYSCSAAYCLGFDAPPAQRIATDFSHAENLSMRARFSGHALKGQKFIAQGKRSDTLGKPPHPITLRPVRAKAKHNTLCFSTFALTGRKLHGTLYPGCRFAYPGLRRSLGFQPTWVVRDKESATRS